MDGQIVRFAPLYNNIRSSTALDEIKKRMETLSQHTRSDAHYEFQGLPVTVEPVYVPGGKSDIIVSLQIYPSESLRDKLTFCSRSDDDTVVDLRVAQAKESLEIVIDEGKVFYFFNAPKPRETSS